MYGVLNCVFNAGPARFFCELSVYHLINYTSSFYSFIPFHLFLISVTCLQWPTYYNNLIINFSRQRDNAARKIFHSMIQLARFFTIKSTNVWYSVCYGTFKIAHAPTIFWRPNVDMDFGLSKGNPKARLHTNCEHTPKTSENVLINERK